MDNTGPVSVSTHYKSSQRKFFKWALKWFHADQTEDIIIKPDAPELACLLQAIGFQLREFNKREDNNGEDKIKKESLKVIIECGSSKMRAVMEMDDVACQCPNQDDAEDASFWSVSGTGPLGSMENMNKVVETGSNLLPIISKGDANVLRDVTQYLLKVIKNIPDMNQNTDSNLNLASIKESKKISSDDQTNGTPLIRRHTEPDFITPNRYRSLDTLTKNDESLRIKSGNSSAQLSQENLPEPRNRSASESRREPQLRLWSKPNPKEDTESTELRRSSIIASSSFPASLQRQKTFDMDIDTSSIEGEPRPSPPKISSSPVPVPQLCMSLGHISLQSDGKDASLVEMLYKAKTNLEIALKMLVFSPGSQKMDSEDIFLKPAPPRCNSSFKISPGNSRPASSCSLPITTTTSGYPNVQKSSVRRNVATSFRKNPEELKLLADKKSTPTNRSLLLQRRNNLGNRVPTPRQLGLRIDTSKPGISGNSSTLTTSRMIVAAKRRVSPDTKNSPAQIQKPNTSLNTSSSLRNTLSSHHKLQTSIPSPKNLIPGGNTAANKFGFVKKKV